MICAWYRDWLKDDRASPVHDSGGAARCGPRERKGPRAGYDDHKREQGNKIHGGRYAGPAPCGAHHAGPASRSVRRRVSLRVGVSA